jgi:hypothetical protein
MRTFDTSEAGLIELVGDAPRWIWAFTCPTPGCDCRTAIVLSTDGDRQTLIARGSPVRDAWLRGESHAKAAAALDGIAAFAIDIDEGGVFPAHGEDPFAAFDFDAHSEARHVVDRSVLRETRSVSTDGRGRRFARLQLDHATGGEMNSLGLRGPGVVFRTSRLHAEGRSL